MKDSESTESKEKDSVDSFSGGASFFFRAETPPKAAVFHMGAECSASPESEENVAAGVCFASSL